MPKKSATKGPRSTSAKKPKSAGMKDLPMKAHGVASAEAVRGGGTRAPKEPAPSSQVSLNFTKVQMEY